jgi:hypothetical protein
MFIREGEIMQSRGITIAKRLGVLVVCILFLFIFFKNSAPLGAESKHLLGDSFFLGPDNRIDKRDDGIALIQNYVYLNTNMSFKYDYVKVKIIFQNSNKALDLKVGYKDKVDWHYNNQIAYSSTLDDLNWDVIGLKPYLYQKQHNFDLIEKFYSNPPINSTIGFYNYNRSDFINSNTELHDYEKLDKKITLNIPLRGPHILYAYLEGETFELDIEKRDLNWYEDPDPMDIKIYKDNDLVYEATIQDDGIVDALSQLGKKQTISLKNPGPDLPEPGIYRIEFDGSNDSVITKLTTNLNRLIFEGPINPINNAEVYGDLVAQTQPLEIYSNSNYYTFITSHNASVQKIRVDEQDVDLSQVGQPYVHKISGPREIHRIIFPKGGDVVTNGTGFFSFSPDRFFEPLPFNSLQIKNKSDLDQVDYILTSYKPTQKIGDDRVAEIEFDLSDAVIQKGKLSWLISAPGLKESGGEILIKDIEFTFTKKGWFQ